MPGYTLPDGLTLKNQLGATSHEELQVAEADYVKTRHTAHLKALHRHLFQDVYEWAGQTRDERFRMSDGVFATEPFLRKVDGQPFMEGRLIARELDRIAGKLAGANHLRGLDRDDFAIRAADLMVDLNGVHPFREGNGRTQRSFVRELAKQAGHRLDFSAVSRERMIQASIMGNERGDPNMMRRLFKEVSNPVRVAALRKAIAALDQHRFVWNDRYLATTEPDHQVEVLLAGVAGDQFMARTKTAILIGKASDLPERRPEVGQRFTLQPTAWGDEKPFSRK